MLKFERSGITRLGVATRDVLCLPSTSAGEAEDSLRNGGFVPCGEASCEDSGDEDGCPRPPPPAFADEGGTWNNNLSMNAVPMKLWCVDEDTKSGVGFDCKYDVAKSVLYAKLFVQTEDEGARAHEADAGERSLKRAISSVFDVAEACNARRMTIGLGSDHSGNPEFVCSLLYLGFEVVHPQKSPLDNVTLMLDFNIDYPGSGSCLSSDHTHTGTSDCSTSACCTSAEGTRCSCRWTPPRKCRLHSRDRGLYRPTWCSATAQAKADYEGTMRGASKLSQLIDLARRIEAGHD